MTRSVRRVALVGAIGLVYARAASSAVGHRTPLGPYHGDGTPIIISGLAAVPNSATVYAAGDDGLYRSEDGGAHWTVAFRDVSGVLAVALQPGLPSTVYAEAYDGLFRSTDAG